MSPEDDFPRAVSLLEISARTRSSLRLGAARPGAIDRWLAADLGVDWNRALQMVFTAALKDSATAALLREMTPSEATGDGIDQARRGRQSAL
jgi:hypothetical protein